MLSHLRLARARGSLVAPNSQVQDRALEFLLLLDQRAERDARLDKVKSLLVPPGSFDEAKAWFPEYFEREDPFAKALDEDGNIDPDMVDESAIEWSAPASEDEDEEIARFIASRESGSVSASDFDHQR